MIGVCPRGLDSTQSALGHGVTAGGMGNCGVCACDAEPLALRSSKRRSRDAIVAIAVTMTSRLQN